MATAGEINWYIALTTVVARQKQTGSSAVIFKELSKMECLLPFRILSVCHAVYFLIWIIRTDFIWASVQWPRVPARMFLSWQECLEPKNKKWNMCIYFHQQLNHLCRCVALYRTLEWVTHDLMFMMEVNMNTSVFWDVADVCCFGETCSLHLYTQRVKCMPLHSLFLPLCFYLR
jgi:hypothetical protein